MNAHIILEVSGDYALFSRPEMKVERVSYDVLTPSAARGILEAIYWKPQIRWIINRITVINPIRFTNIRRNEVGKKMPSPDKKVMSGEKQSSVILIEDERQQRASLILTNVAYIIEARIDLLDRLFEKNGLEMPANEAAGKHLEMFNRRARKGQYFHHPCLGTREFPASFSLLELDNDIPTPHPELSGEKPLGFMLHDIEFEQDPKTKNLKSTTPRFFRAEMKDGIITVPPFHQSIA